MSKHISTKEALQVIYDSDSDSENYIFDDGDEEMEQYMEPFGNDKVFLECEVDDIQSVSDIEIEDDCEEESAEDMSIYISKSGVDFSNKPPRQGQCSRVNIMHGTPDFPNGKRIIAVGVKFFWPSWHSDYAK